ncbi:13123_t:CDS:2, partial [Acaulospora morrowiae]
TKSWADQTQNEDMGESSQSQFNGDNSNNKDESVNNNSSVQQNRQQYNNNRRANGKFAYSAFSVQVGNLTVPVSEGEIQDFFTSAECQVERVKLIYDRSSKDQLDHCYVDFQDGVSLEKAIQLNGQPFGANQNPLKIRKADPENRSNRWRGRGRGRGGYKHRGNGQHNNTGSNHVQNGSSQ